MYSQKYLETHTRWLRRDLNALEKWYEALEDGQGAAFREAFRAAAVRERVEPDEQQTWARYKPFDSFTGFVNEISYDANARENLQRLFLARNHEGIHALQFSQAAALHADLSNRNAAVMIYPRDYLRIRLLAEKDAHSKELWLASLAAKKGLLKDPDRVFSLMPVSAFDEISTSAAGLPEALAAAAEAVMDKDVLMPTAAGAGIMKCRDVYCAHALRDYANGLSARQTALAENRLVFARLEPEDLRVVGESFGPNLYDQGIGAASLADDTLAVSNRILLDQMLGFLGIADEDDLPPFSVALAEKGTDPAGFLAQSRGASSRTGGIIAPKPLAYR